MLEVKLSVPVEASVDDVWAVVGTSMGCLTDILGSWRAPSSLLPAVSVVASRSPVAPQVGEN